MQGVLFDMLLTGVLLYVGLSLIGLPPYRIAQAGLGLVPEGRWAFVWVTDENGGCPLNYARMVSVESEATPVMVGAFAVRAYGLRVRIDEVSGRDGCDRRRVQPLVGDPSNELAALADRVEALGGTLRVSSRPAPFSMYSMAAS